MPGGDTKFQFHWLDSNDRQGHRISEWCEQDPTDAYKASCTLCNKSFSVSNSGKQSILKHGDGDKHKNLQKVLVGQKLLRGVSPFVVQPSKSATATVTGSSAPATKPMLFCGTTQEDVEKAEALWVMKMCAEDWSFASCDGVSDLFSKMFRGPVSSVFSLGRNKASYIVSDGLGPYFKKKLVEDINSSEAYFTIHFDETTTQQVKKQLDILVRYWSASQEQVVVHFFKAVLFGHAKAVDVSKCLLESLSESGYQLQSSKLLGLSSDGPNVNKAIWRLMNDHLKADGLPGLLPFIPCSLHVAHNGFRYGLKEYGSEVDQLCLDLFYWFKISPCKREDFLGVLNDLDLEERFFIRHVQSRWLTLGPATERVLANYTAITEYFLKHISGKEFEKNDKYRRICTSLKDKYMPVKLKFVSSLAKVFDPFLHILQSEGPVVHILYDQCCQLIRSVFIRFLKDEMCTKEITEVEYEKVENQLAYVDLKRGSTDKAPSELEMKKMRECYIVIARYLIKNLPIGSSLLKNLEILHPLMRKQPGTSRRLKKLLVAVPQVIPEVDTDTTVTEWNMYTHEEVPEEWFVKEVMTDKTIYHRIDHYWREVLRMKNSAGLLKYPKLKLLVQALLSIAHGNADVERSLSYNKKTLGTDRSTMTHETLSGIRMINDHVKDKKATLHNMVLPREMLQSCKLASSNYRRRKEEEQRKKAETEREKKRRANEEQEEKESIQRDRKKVKGKEDDLAKKEKGLVESQKVAEELFSQGNTHLSKAIKERNFVDAGVAQSLLDAAKTKMDSVQKELTTLRDSRKDLDKRKRKLLDKYQATLDKKEKKK